MAYASTWNLDMPFWLGIYWAGPLEKWLSRRSDPTRYRRNDVGRVLRTARLLWLHRLEYA